MSSCQYYLVEKSNSLNHIRELLSELAVAKQRYEEHTPFTYTAVDDPTEILLQGYAFSKQNNTSPAGWYSLFEELTEDDFTNRFTSSSHSGLLVVEYLSRVWILTFGQAFRIAEELPVEARFGRISVSNAMANTNALRGFVSQTFGKHSKVRMEAVANDGPMDRLVFLTESNRLKRLRASIEIGKSNNIVEGGIALRFPRPKDFEQLRDILEQMLEWWNSGIEAKIEIALKDPVYEIRDDKRINTYNSIYENLLSNTNGPTNNFYLNFDITELWNAEEYWLTINKKILLEVGIPEPKLFVETVRSVLSHETSAEKLRVQFLLSDGTKTSRDLRSVLSFIKEQDPGENFLVLKDEGRWWEYKSSWIGYIDKLFNSHQKRTAGTASTLRGLVEPFDRSKYENKKNKEELWIEDQIPRIPGSKRGHIGSNIPISGSRSNVELADIYLPGNFFLADKRAGELRSIY